MDYAVGGRHGRLGEIAVEEFKGVGEKKMLGDGIYHVEASVVLDPWRPRKSHDRQVPGLLWMMTDQPIGKMGVASKLKGPLKCSQADMYRARVDWRRRFNVSSVCGRSWSHMKLG